MNHNINCIHIMPRINLFCIFCNARINNYCEQACVRLNNMGDKVVTNTMCRDHWLIYCTEKAWDPELSFCVNERCDMMQIDFNCRLLMGPNEVYKYTGLNGYHYTNVSENRRHKIHVLYSLYKCQLPMVYMGPVETYLTDENDTEFGTPYINIINAEIVTSEIIESYNNY